MYFVIINQNFSNIGINGYINAPNFFDEDSIKQKISSKSYVPKAYITNLYHTFNGRFYQINYFNYNSKSTIHAMINDTYNSLYSSISSLSYENSFLRKDYDSLRTANDSNQKRISELTQKNQDNQYRIDDLTRQNQNNQNRIDDLTRQNQNNQNRINDLNQQNQKLNQKIQEEENLRKLEKEKFNKFKKTFEEEKIKIEKEHIGISEQFICKFIVNKFVKEFETKNNKKNSFTTSLIQYMEKFNEEYMQYCTNFLSSFKANSQKIVNEFNINDNNILIEHINFIVIGKAGVGKSAFINESLHLPKEKRAKEGIGKSVTDKSMLYSSDKLKMVRMWDTQGLDYKISQENILNEVKEIVEEGLKKGPDHYINIILYCTTGERFQDEDGQLIYEIMKLYPSDNLPVIITQLQAYFVDRVKEMEKTIRSILSNYLDSKIADKIEIRDVIARDQKGGKEVFKARGIPELLKLAVELMGRAITSATCKKFSEEIENLCKNFVDKKINFIKEQFKYEMEILEQSKSMFVEDMDDYFDNQDEKKIKELSELNMYKKIDKKTYFQDNFIKIMVKKFIEIYNYLNDNNIQLNKNEENVENNENNNQQNHENVQNQENQEGKNNSQINQENNEEKQENKENQNIDKNEDKPLVLFFIEDRLPKLKKIINDSAKKIFEKVFKIKFQDYLSDLQKKQSLINKEFDVNYQIIDVAETEQTFRDELLKFFNNEFFKNFFCIILKLFMTNLKNTLIDNYKKELKENEKMKEVINKKAEDSLRFITQKLQESLLKELNENYPDNDKKVEERANKEFNEINCDDMNFDY